MEGDEVGALAGLDATDDVVEAEVTGGVEREQTDGGGERHSGLDHPDCAGEHGREVVVAADDVHQVFGEGVVTGEVAAVEPPR